MSDPTPPIAKFLTGGAPGNAYRDIPRPERLIDVVCERKARPDHGHLVGVVSPRSFDLEVATLATSQGSVPLSGRHVLGAATETPITQTLPDWFARCTCGEVHAIPLEPLAKIVTSMRTAGAMRLPFRVSVSTLIDAATTP